MATPRYKRILLKLSGEALAGEQKYGIDPATVSKICAEVARVVTMGVQVALVIGGGNIFRGMAGAARGMDRSTADYMGMLATVMNSVAVQDALEAQGQPTRVLSAITICAGGTGNPYFTTDTTAALRGMELRCDIIIKATKVDGVYDKDPLKFPDAVMFRHLTHEEAIARRLGVMDTTAITLAMENKMPIVVCNMFGGQIARLVTGEAVGTMVS